ncbi:hypothetical protein JXA85_08505 [Candidatus Woesearchaeota archaeon]|nr:hypothetical protein [Candidatus Woesearchaeota archaeon]
MQKAIVCSQTDKYSSPQREFGAVIDFLIKASEHGSLQKYLDRYLDDPSSRRFVSQTLQRYDNPTFNSLLNWVKEEHIDPNDLRQADRLIYQSLENAELLSKKKLNEKIKYFLEQEFPGIDQSKLEDYLGKISDRILELQKLSAGYSSKNVLRLDNYVIKIDDFKRANLEHKILSLDLGEFSNYCPKPISAPVSIGGFGIWRMNDLKKEKPGYEKTGIADELEHYMKLIALFHTNATKAVKKNGIVLPVGHSSNMNYIDEAKMIFDRTGVPLNGEKNKLDNLKSPVNDIQNYIIENADTVIMGDLKIPENTVNGYIVDFGSVRWGSPAEDLARAFISKGLDYQDIVKYTNKYIQFRCQVDPEFREDMYKQSQLHSLVAAASINENMRFSRSMNKRIGILKPSKVLTRTRDHIHNAYSVLKDNKLNLNRLLIYC